MRGLGRSALAITLFLLPFTWGATAAVAQEGPGFAGHWVGAIQTPNGDLGINVDLAVSEEGVWSGDISIPAQGAVDFALADVVVDGSTVSFRMDGVAGDPTFSGTLSEDGTTISGPFTQGGAELQFILTRQES